MADPNNPNDPSVSNSANPTDPALIQKSNEYWKNYGLTLTNINTTTSTFNDLTNDMGKLLGSIGDAAKGVKDAFLSGTPITKEYGAAFGVITTAVLGSTNAFKLLTENTKLDNFGSQIQALVGQSVASAKSIDDLTKIASRFGIKIPSIGPFNALSAALIAGAKNMGDAADQAFKYQNSIIEAMGASGQLNNFLRESGDRLTNVDNVMRGYAESVASLSAATKVSLPELYELQNQLAKEVPGALTATVNGLGNGTKSMTELQAVIQVAHGTGRSFTDIVGGMTTAFEKYGLKGSEALAFTTRATELSDKFGISLKDTQGFMTEMADSFKYLGDNAEGTAAVFADLFRGLRDGAKIGAQPAIEIIKGVQESLSNLSTAQKAFLSSRTGGPGGLLGAVQIEQLLASGKTEEVFNKMKSALQQQFGGRIVTRDQVKTESDAAIFTRQKMLLQSGAFGGLAKTDNQAADLLKALSSPGGDKLVNAQKLLTDATKTGSDREEQIHTSLIDANKQLQEIKMFGGITAFGILKQVGAGATNEDKLTQQLQQYTKNATEEALTATTQRKDNVGRDTTGDVMTKALYGLHENISTGASELNRLKNETVKSFTFTDATKAVNKASSDFAKIKSQINDQNANAADNVNTTRSAAVGVAARVSTAETNPITVGNTNQQNAPNQVKATTTPNSITVNVIGICPDCHKKFVQNPQKAAINNADPGY